MKKEISIIAIILIIMISVTGCGESLQETSTDIASYDNSIEYNPSNIADIGDISKVLSSPEEAQTASELVESFINAVLTDADINPYAYFDPSLTLDLKKLEISYADFLSKIENKIRNPVILELLRNADITASDASDIVSSLYSAIKKFISYQITEEHILQSDNVEYHDTFYKVYVKFSFNAEGNTDTEFWRNILGLNKNVKETANIIKIVYDYLSELEPINYVFDVEENCHYFYSTNDNTNVENWFGDFGDDYYLDDDIIDDVKLLTKEQTEMLLNALYAYHGYSFMDAKIKQSFEGRSWYKAQGKDMSTCETEFNSYENTNRDRLINYEIANGWR